MRIVSSPLAAVLVPVLALVLMLSAGCSYRAGTASAEKFDEWVKDHPIRGSRIVDTVGTDRYAFVGELTAYARLTAEPTGGAITDAMSDLCAFDAVASTPATYWLQVERISMQVICTDAGRERLVAFYAATKGLTTLTSVFLDRTGVQGEAPDDVVPAVAGEVFAAADASGTVEAGATYTFDGEHVHVETVPGVDLGAALSTARDVLPVVGPALSRLGVTDGLVVTETTGSVAEARQWQAAVEPGAATTLLVVPVRVTADAPLTAAQRSLVERLSTDDRVTLVSTYADHWAIDVAAVAGARSLLPDLAGDDAATSLGTLTVERVVEDGPSCYVVPALPSLGGAQALLDLCARDDVPRVDGRFGLEVRLTSDDLRAVLVAAHALPDGTSVSISSEGPRTSGSYSFTTGPTLTFEQDFDSDNALQRLWAETAQPS